MILGSKQTLNLERVVWAQISCIHMCICTDDSEMMKQLIKKIQLWFLK